MGPLVLLLWFSVVISATEQTPSYLITAPNIIHVGVKESVAIQLEGAENPVHFNVFLFDVVTYTRCSDVVVFELKAENNYQQIKDIMALPRSIKAADIWLRKEKYISLVAECPQLFPGRRMVPVLLSSKKGYIFIQTDKPIYTPNEVVRYRIFTLDHYMRPVSKAIRITTYNSRNVQFPSFPLMSRKVITRTLKIPDIAQPGNWRIEAQFDDSPMYVVSTQFEVKKFVLPSFKVEVKAEEMFYLITKDEFKFKILADHVYGKAVEGMAYVRFEIIDEMKNNTYLRGLEQQLQIKNGVVMSSLTTKMLLENIKPLESMNLVGHHLYMAVTVFETSSGEMEEVELRNIKFVSSPYVIDLSKTSGYFVPRVPFSVLVQVTYPDGSPASGVPVTLEGEKLQLTQENGQVVLSLPSPEAADVLEIKVTAGDGTTGREISKAKKTVRIYQSKTKSYLHVNVPHHVLDPDSSFSADLTAITPAGSGDIKYYYYMIISKGKVLEINRLLKTEFMKIHLSLNIAMVPAFRLVIYYYTNVGGKTEMVANSAWVDVKDVCEGKITIKNMPKEYYRPGRMVTLSVETEDSGSLSLAVVDTAIYILNNKNKLTPNKVFEEMNSYDLGCTFGGGADSVGVFMDAGLTFISNVDTSVIRDGYSCKRDSRRMKRSLDIQAQYVGKVGHYTNSSLRKCCVDGMTAILMKRTCEDRSKRVKEEECRKAFLTCCEFAVELRNNQSRKLDAVGRMAESDGDDFFDETSVHVRSNFPQSWEWRTHPIAHAGVKKINLHLPDSITTWEIQAVGMFEKKGFCVAEPKKMKVFRPVFISLRLPYSVKRNEQLEVRAILYNYHFEDIEMKIYMKPVDVLCSPATGEKHARTVTVRANSAYPIYFSVVPLTIGDIPITVVAYSNTDVTVSDAVTGKLKVLGEGVLKTEDHSIFINPRARSSYHIFEEMPSNIVPDTKSYLYVRARGEVMGETVQNCLTPEGIDRLIKVPKGCAEQTTVLMAPTVFAVKYLDKSDQWLCLKAERKDEALEHIETGYKKILEYKKDDGSYGIYLHRPSSTWLTAFIVKILSIVRSQIDVEKNHIQQSVLYVVNGQRETGEFYDPHPVLDRGMQGGIGGLESNIATTAFVTIALVNSLPSFHGNAENKKQVDESIARAVKYLSNQLADIKRAYVLAITAYALAFVDPDSSVAHEADTKLKQMATYDEDNDVRYWKADEKSSHIGESRPGRVPQASAVTVEATSYALLQTIAMKDLHYAKAIVKWLTEQRKDGGGFRSTQDTVIALEALTEYSIATFMPEEVDMKLTFINPERGPIQTLSIQRNNTLIQDELQFQLGQNISVKVSGKGTGTLTVLKTYHLLAEPTSSCDYFKLEVTVKGKVEYVEHPDYSNYEDYVDPLQRDQPLREIDWFDLRSRRRRDMPDADKDKTIYYEICVWHEPDGVKNQRVSGMAIVDISLLSGFEPDNTDLNKLKNLADRYIDSYEFKDGRVLLYLETVHEYRECVVFGAKQIFPIGLIQPASATLYDYYNPSTKCTVFYNAPEKSTIVSKLCQNDVCECAEGHCPRIKRTFSPDVARDARMDFACYSPIVEYAFIVTVSGISNTGNFDVYKVSIIKRIKLASDESIMVNGIRHFLKRNACPLKLQLHKSYLLMGKDGKTKDANRNIQYVLDSNSWIEEIPPADKCKATKARSTCEKLKKFIADLGTTGCQM